MALTEEEKEFIEELSDKFADKVKGIWQTPQTPQPENPDAADPERNGPTTPEAETAAELETPASRNSATAEPETPTIQVETDPEPTPPEPKQRRGLPFGQKRRDA